MKKIVLTTLPLLLILGCGDATTPIDSEETVQIPTKNTKTIRALGVDFEWQAEVDARKSWDEARDYCAQKQMRLPSPEEFFALLDTNQSIDTLFPSDIKEFWTDKAYDSDKAWKITTWSSSQSYHDKNQSLGVRCLNGATLDTHTYTKVSDAFIDKNNNTNEEKRWQDESDTSINRLTFSQAKNYCQAKDMRLPTIFELQQILKTTPTHLQKDDFLSYWSSTPLPTDSESMMTVNFTTGGVLFSDKGENNHLRCVQTIDNIPPVISLNAAAEITLHQDESYLEAGATASDNVDGNLNVTISGSVDTSTVGEYTLTYSASDKAGNTTSLTRVIHIVDVTMPTITLNGLAILNINQGESYTELGAIAHDNTDGNLTVTISGSVDTSTVGTYTLTYTATDSAGNSVQSTRKVTVLDITAPIITINGDNPMILNQHDSYTEAGAMASDAVDGTLNVTISGSVDTTTAGTYTITYSAQDSAGNSASHTRTITVKDTTKPTITLIGSNLQEVRLGDNYNEQGATVSDNVALSGTIMIDASAVDTSTVGDYEVLYSISDTSGNSATTSRTVRIIDTIKPIIILIGDNTQQIEVNTTYTELGASATDNSDGDISTSIMIDSSAVNTQTIGDYQVTYDVNDSSNNPATQAIRVIQVRDTTAPIITLSGNASVSINQGESYSDAGANVEDNYDSDVTITTNNPVNTSIVGEYTIIYTATDSSGNSASKSRTVTVNDVTAPIITLGGDNPFTLEVNTPYNEPGVTAIDAIDGNINVSSSGLATTATVGDYTITYSATDNAGNVATKTRTVHIVDSTKPSITLNGNATITLEVGSSYSDAGATASDNYDTALSVISSGSVDTSTLGTYILYYDVNDSAGNNATQKTRTITVEDTTPPIISLIGAPTTTVNKGTSYVDAGASASDNYEGNISSNIVIVNPVNKNIAGTYQVTYNVSDTSGNSATQITRTVIVQDTSMATNDFTPHTVTTHASNSEWLEMVDIDKDGDLDILSASTGNAGAEVAWYENHGDYTFTEHIIAVDVNSPESIKAADMDNDGDLDILYTTYDGAGASLKQCINDGSQTFACADIANTTGGLSYIDIVDIDNDGKKDIVSASWTNNRIDWYKNNGDGTYASPSLIDNANMTNAISLDYADFDKDGDMDIVTAANGDNRVDWYENNGSGTFTPHFIDNTIQGIYSVKIADVSNNGYVDIITTSHNNNEVYWHASSETSTPNFLISNTVATLTNVYYASGVDMDNDGDIDILSNSSEIGGKIAWYENDGTGSGFSEHIIASNVDNVIRVFAADIDNDGNIDIVAGDSAGNVIVYENNATNPVTLLPKTGDSNDGETGGGDYSFSRDDTTEIVSEALTGLMWQDDSAVGSGTTNDTSVANSRCQSLTNGGFDDWRVPNRYELYYLAQKSSTVLDTIFENESRFLKDYWTSSSNNLYVRFSNATINVASSINYTRCVRGEPITFSFIRDDNKNVVMDKKHALMWDDSSSAKRLSSSWDDAKTTCSSLSVSGYGGWRVPNVHELISLFDDEGLNKAFQNRPTETLISSTTDTQSTSKAYAIDIDGLDSTIDKSSSVTFRCVREIP